MSRGEQREHRRPGSALTCSGGQPSYFAEDTGGHDTSTRPTLDLLAVGARARSGTLMARPAPRAQYQRLGATAAEGPRASRL